MSMRWLPTSGEHSLEERDAATAVASLRASMCGGAAASSSETAVPSSRSSAMSTSSLAASDVSMASATSSGGGQKRPREEMAETFAGTEATIPKGEYVPAAKIHRPTFDAASQILISASQIQPQPPAVAALPTQIVPAVAAATSATAPPASADSTFGLPSESDTECGSGFSPNGAPRKLRAAPFFYYRDYSRAEDDDPLTPLTAPGRVPNFPAKMQAILSRPELNGIIAWSTHGRAFRVLRPRQFEVRVIPTYFEHSKFSSFVRQANGWGFKRITRGPDRNCYYHEMFLRDMPHLCKKMKRPGASGKMSSDPRNEPDLYKISEMFPIQGCPQTDDQAIRLESTVQGGPKARMPVHMGLQMVQNMNNDQACFRNGALTSLLPNGESKKDDQEWEDDRKIAAKPSAALDAELKSKAAALEPPPAVAAKLPAIAPKPATAIAPVFPTITVQPIVPKLPPIEDFQAAAPTTVTTRELLPKLAAVLAPKPPSVATVPPRAVVPLPNIEPFTLQAATAVDYPTFTAPNALRQQQPNEQHQALIPVETGPFAATAGVPAAAASMVPPVAAQLAAIAPAPPMPHLPTPQDPDVHATPAPVDASAVPQGTDVDGASHFAAGFAAATALNGSAIQSVLQQALAGAASAVQQTRALQQLQATQIAQLQMQQAQANRLGLHLQHAQAQGYPQLAPQVQAQIQAAPPVVAQRSSQDPATVAPPTHASPYAALTAHLHYLGLPPAGNPHRPM